MAKIIKSHLGNFLVILILGAVFITGFLFLKNLSVEAQEQIKIFPTSFTGDWQNPEAVFSQDLSENATFEEFNTKNSAYPLEILEILPEETVTSPEEGMTLPTEEMPVEEEIIEEETPAEEIPEEEIPTEENPLEEGGEEFIEEPIEEPAEQEQQGEEPEPTSFWNKVGNFFKGIVWAQEENQEENQEPLSEPEVEEEQLPQEELPEELAEELPEESSEEPIIEEPIIEEPLIEEPVIEVEIPPIEKILELSNFSISEDFQERIIQNAQLRLSLAGKGEVGDKLIIDYFYQNIWQNLAEFNLEQEISNNLNGGYFLYALPIFENWEELDNLKIKFTYVGETDSQSLVYLDAIWLEVEYEEKESIVEEEIIKEEEGVGVVEEEEEYTLEMTSDKDDFELNEEPVFKFRYQKKRSFVEAIGAGILNLFRDEYKDINIKATVLGLNISPNVRYQESGEFLVELEKPRQFRPGKYRLKIEIEDNGQTFAQEQEFTWGVLAINTNKSIYLPNEQAYLQMAALQDDGHTICDANLSLTITASNGEIANPSVQRSGECGPDNVTDKPDYFTYYQTGETGIYQMKLTNFDNGYKISDSFEVRESVPFGIERIGPTRIYPPAVYEMRMIIKANEDFQGEIIETTPLGFRIENIEYRLNNNSLNSNSYILNSSEAQEIHWEVDFKKDDFIELKYTFDAPNISPYLYLLGPLKIGDFQEIRQWQIASDADYDVTDDFEAGWGNWTDIDGDCHWTRHVGELGSGNTGADYDHTYDDADHYKISVECSSSVCQGTDLEAVTERNIDGSSYTLSLEIWYHMYGSGMGAMHVDIYDGTWHNDLWSISGAQHSSETEAFSSHTVDLSSYDSATKVRIRYDGVSSYAGDIALDDLRVYGDLKIVYTLTQNDWRWYENADNVQPGTAKANENTAITGVNPAEVLRTRMNLTVTDGDMAADSKAFKLQYGQGTDCTAIGTWNDVGAIDSGTIWRGYNNSTPADGATIGVSDYLLSASDVAESYEEENNSVNNPRAINATQDGEWDWVVQENGATTNTTYCFRMVESDDTALDGYNTDGYPKLTTGGPYVKQLHYRWRNDDGGE